MPSLDPEDSGSSRENRLALVAVIASALVFSTSPVVIKVVLRYTGPLTAGGLRFLIAFVFLFLWLRLRRQVSPKPTRSHWLSFFLIGLCTATASGALFFALVTLSPTTASLAFCLTPTATLIFGIIWLKEHPSPIQLLGLGLAIAGSFIFFSPKWEAGQGLAIGLLIVFILADTGSVVIAREIARHRQVSSLALTAYPMAIGGVLLFSIGLGFEGIPRMPISGWGILTGVALVNTAMAYLFFNYALRNLTAIKAYIVVNFSPFGTALLSWVAFGERLMPTQIVAMLIAVTGISLVQHQKHRQNRLPH
jgi:drug/metabolite transporter (DMT)-like permease